VLITKDYNQQHVGKVSTRTSSALSGTGGIDTDLAETSMPMLPSLPMAPPACNQRCARWTDKGQKCLATNRGGVTEQEQNKRLLVRCRPSFLMIISKSVLAKPLLWREQRSTRRARRARTNAVSLIPPSHKVLPTHKASNNTRPLCAE
jgi:hypothetical protein